MYGATLVCRPAVVYMSMQTLSLVTVLPGESRGR